MILPETAVTLSINLDRFGFVNREKSGGKILKNRCGRDFLYYALHYLFPETYNPNALNPEEIERRRLFGARVPSWLAWLQAQFIKLPSFLTGIGAEL